jgi:hypothetical protein
LSFWVNSAFKWSWSRWFRSPLLSVFIWSIAKHDTFVISYRCFGHFPITPLPSVSLIIHSVRHYFQN